MAIVEFTKDCYPYCKGDRLQMDAEEMKDAEALAKERGISGKPYKVVDDVKVPGAVETVDAVDTQADVDRVRPLLDQSAAEANLVAPGVEAVQAVEADREDQVVAKKRK